MISLVDIEGRYQEDADQIERAVGDVLRSGQWIGGPVVADIEERIANLMGWPHAVGVANGTDALEMCLKVLGVGSGDEVVIPAVSFFATAGAVRRVGARPVIVDIRSDRPLLDWSQISMAREDDTRAIMPVHLFGMNAGRGDTDLPIVDDLAQAAGAEVPIGAGRLGGLSFYPTKILSGAGDGGMVLCGDRQIAEQIRRLGNHGVVEGKYDEVQGSVGGNSRLDPIHAAIIGVQMGRLARRIERRREIYASYRDQLGDLVVEQDAGSPISVLCIRHPRRDALRTALAERGISTGCYYPRTLAEEPALAHARVVGELPNARAFCAEALAIPCHAGLHDDDIARVSDVVGGFA